jgi:hypothetical protein
MHPAENQNEKNFRFSFSFLKDSLSKECFTCFLGMVILEQGSLNTNTDYKSF